MHPEQIIHPTNTHNMMPFLVGFAVVYILSVLIVAHHGARLEKAVQEHGVYSQGTLYVLLYTPLFNSLLAIALTWLVYLEKRRHRDRTTFLEAAYRLEELANSDRIASEEQRKILMGTVDYLKQMANERRTD